jgi:hypothetical protein
MHIEQGAVVTLERLTIQHGRVGIDEGGGILNQGTLNLVDSAISGSGAFIGGGGISNDRTVVLYATSSITGNSATRGGNQQRGFSRRSVLLQVDQQRVRPTIDQPTASGFTPARNARGWSS